MGSAKGTTSAAIQSRIRITGCHAVPVLRVLLKAQRAQRVQPSKAGSRAATRCPSCAFYSKRKGHNECSQAKQDHGLPRGARLARSTQSAKGTTSAASKAGSRAATRCPSCAFYSKRKGHNECSQAKQDHGLPRGARLARSTQSAKGTTSAAIQSRITGCHEVPVLRVLLKAQRAQRVQPYKAGSRAATRCPSCAFYSKRKGHNECSHTKQDHGLPRGARLARSTQSAKGTTSAAIQSRITGCHAGARLARSTQSAKGTTSAAIQSRITGCHAVPVLRVLLKAQRAQRVQPYKAGSRGCHEVPVLRVLKRKPQ